MCVRVVLGGESFALVLFPIFLVLLLLVSLYGLGFLLPFLSFVGPILSRSFPLLSSPFLSLWVTVMIRVAFLLCEFGGRCEPEGGGR